MKKNIVITTIYPKTPAVVDFENLDDWHVILVGDKKTPNIESSATTHYLSYEQQCDLGFHITKHLPANHYTRKNVGYLYALSRGGQLLYDTDDDNYPYDDWYVPSFSSEHQLTSTNKFINVYKYFSSQTIWPRGFPLDEIHGNEVDMQPTDQVKIGVWQGLADKDPDVDAIYRLVNNTECVFDKKAPVHLGKYQYCPFNSQNTTWNMDVLPLMYLPCTVSFRFTDILRGYIAQRIMWEYDYLMGFHEATVYQHRNDHNLMSDFEDEIVCYTKIKELVEVLETLSLGRGIAQDLLTVYEKLTDVGFTAVDEIATVEAWLIDVETLTNA